MNIQLKTCPICGSFSVYDWSHADNGRGGTFKNHYVRCFNRCVQSQQISDVGKTEEEAQHIVAHIWNTRTGEL